MSAPKRRSNAQLHLVLPTAPKPSARADWQASEVCVRAQSILCGSLVASARNPSGQCPPLSLEQARDVIAWHDAHLTKQAAKPARRWPFTTARRGDA